MQRGCLTTSVPIPQGTLQLIWRKETGLLAQISWNQQQSFVLECESIAPAAIQSLARRLQYYFSSGEPLGEVPWSLFEKTELTEFQEKVYRACTLIPHGETRTYAWIGARIRQPSAARAIGQALKKNPFPILIPCHRVTSALSIGGFMGLSDPNCPEVAFKKFLIETEHTYVNPIFPFLLAPSAA